MIVKEQQAKFPTHAAAVAARCWNLARSWLLRTRLGSGSLIFQATVELGLARDGWRRVDWRGVTNTCLATAESASVPF